MTTPKINDWGKLYPPLPYVSERYDSISSALENSIITYTISYIILPKKYGLGRPKYQESISPNPCVNPVKIFRPTGIESQDLLTYGQTC